MKDFIKQLVIGQLNILANFYIWKYKPTIITVTGNVGKTSTKEAIATVLSRFKKVRSGKGNLNNEFGVPLTIIGDWAEDYYEAGNTFWFWIRVIVVSCWSLVVGRNYPEILVLEYGADKPGDIKKLVKNFKPHIGVVTAVGEVPVHVEFFSGPEGLAKEKANLVKSLEATDFAVLNFDDLVVLEMKDKTKATTITFGFGEGANVRASNLEAWIENGVPRGVSFKINYNEQSLISGHSFVPFKISGSLGKSQGYAAAAAAAVGMILGLNLVQISEALVEYRGPKGRLRILNGIKNSTIIDDTYNASPASTHLALETLRDLSGQRKIAVLGDMLELGEYTESAHREIGNLAGSFVDVLVCVGARAKFIADSAANQLAPTEASGMAQRIYTFDLSNDAKSKVRDLIKEGDLILVKGSQGMRMEKIVEEIMAEPEKKRELLVRQGKKWLST